VVANLAKRSYGNERIVMKNFDSIFRAPRAFRPSWRALLAPCVLGLASAGASAQSASGDVNASATLVRSLQILSSSGLSFGTMSPGATQGTVVIDPAGARSASGGVTLVSTNAGSASSVSLQGTPALTYSVALPETVTLTSSGGASMTLSSLTTNLQSNSGSIGSNGSGNFGIGGTLNVAASQAVAEYSGTFQVTLNWN
jgi:hypothetical protein